METENIHENDWTKPAERYIALLDIMALKNIDKKEQSNDIQGKRTELGGYVLGFETKNKLRVEERILKGELTVLYDIHINNQYPDKIIISTKTDNVDELINLMSIVTSIFLKSIDLKIPITGTIRSGLITIKNSDIFYGKSKIDAYQLQDKLRFYGIVLGYDVEKKLLKSNLDKQSMWKKTASIFESASNLIFYNFNWFNYIPDMDKIINFLNEIKETAPEKSKIYIDNTFEMLKRMNPEIPEDVFNR